MTQYTSELELERRGLVEEDSVGYNVQHLDGASGLEHCPQCGGPLKIIAAIVDPTVIAKILTHLGEYHEARRRRAAEPAA